MHLNISVIYEANYVFRVQYKKVTCHLWHEGTMEYSDLCIEQLVRLWCNFRMRAGGCTKAIGLV
jgi:hypothetical protein